jgi:hypothetical protein
MVAPKKKRVRMAGMFKKNLLLALSVLFLAGGCVREDMAECRPVTVRLHLVYTLNEKYRDDLAASIQDVRIYVYDKSTGILVDVFRSDPSEIDEGYDNISLLPGTYIIVAWASSNPDLFQSGMEEGQIIPPPAPPVIPPPPPPPVDTLPQPPDLAPVKPGETTIDNSHMGLNTNPGGGGTHSPQNNPFGDVFHDSEEALVRPGRDLEEAELDFTGMSSLVNVRIRGLQYLPASVTRPPHVFIEGRNGSLTPTGNVSPDAPAMRYEPYDVANNADEMEARMQTLKLQMNMEQSQPMMLHIQDRATGRDIVAPLNLITLIRSLRDADGNYRYPTQADIDRENEFRIQLDFTPDGGIRVSINDFVTEILIPILYE